ncbi:putative virion structural protein [Aeromonas phage ZPAH34]|uniref:putative virion structural protein n=1 Tax=Aeromonas phage ZPAH34 TaxID=2924888 RepID=UPI0023297A89|nr:putative virion structural protein [Aeromonas phage ZPAH34]UOX39655.1 putative virion structural protein [Aeromonas phage ZPAH34]
MKINELRKGDMVNFDMIAPGIFGSQYKSVLVQGVVGYEAASIIDPELNVKHQNFYPKFKENVNNINDPTIYDYLIIKPDANTNQVIVIGEPWIQPGTLEVTKGRVATILIGDWQERYNAPVKDFFANLNVSYTLQVTDKQ